MTALITIRDVEPSIAAFGLFGAILRDDMLNSGNFAFGAFGLCHNLLGIVFFITIFLGMFLDA